MFKLLKAIFSGGGETKTLRSLDKLADLQINDYIKLNDSFALPAELRGKTFQVASIDSYFYADVLNIEWVLSGDTKKKVYLSLTDFGDEDRIMLSYQLNRKEVDQVFGWDAVKKQYDCNLEENLKCKDVSIFDGWLAEEYYRRECDGKARYFSGDYRGITAPGGGEKLSYFEFYNEEESFCMDVEMWSKSEVDVFISIIRPESDIHEFWAA